MLPPALRHPLFRRYLSGLFVSNIGNTIQAWAIAWHVFDLTQSSLMVGLLGLVRVVPLLVFALFGGVLADQADRRKVMICTQAGMALVALMLFVGAMLGFQAVAGLYGLVALNAVARAFDGPARQSLMVNLVPREDFPNAASLNGVAWRLSDVLAPIITGLLIGGGGLAGLSGLSLCYLLNFLSFFALFAALISLPSQTIEGAGQKAASFGEVIASIREGFAFLNRTPVVKSAMWIDFWATLFSGAEALLPAFAAIILKLGPEGYGVLASATGAGAFLAAVGLTWRKTVIRQGRLVILMIAAYGLFTIGFGLSQTLWMACLCLAGVGASDMISTVMRQTIRQLGTPDALRGRMTATSFLFQVTGPQLGDFEAGAVASVAGERFSIVLGGSLCMLVAAHWSRATALAGYVHRPQTEVVENS